MLNRAAWAVAVLGVLLLGAIWFVLGALDASNMHVTTGLFGRGPSEAATYDQLYRHTLVIARYAIRAERLAYAIPVALFVIAALLFGWARDRARLQSIKRDGDTPNI